MVDCSKLCFVMHENIIACHLYLGSFQLLKIKIIHWWLCYYTASGKHFLEVAL